MIQKFLKNTYVKTALVIICSGGILIVLSNLIMKSKLGDGLAAINNTLMPIYIGMVLAFLFYPIYNRVVKFTFFRLIKRSERDFVPIGAGVINPSDRHDFPSPEEKRSCLKGAKFFATLVCLILLLGISSLLIYSLIPQLFAGTRTFLETFPQRVNDILAWSNEHFTRYPEITDAINQIANARASEIAAWIQEAVFKMDTSSIAQLLSTGLVSVISIVFNIFVGVLIMVYLLNSKDKLFAIGRKIIAATCSERRANSIYEFVTIFNDTFIKFVIGRIIDSTIIGVLTYICLEIFDFSLAPMIAVIIGVTNVIPFFGPFIGAIPSVIILMFEDPMQGLYFIPLILIIQQIDGNIIGPKVVGNAIGIDSFWVLISVLIGGGLFGFLGMALGVPVFALIYRYVDKYTVRKLIDKEKDIATTDYYSLEQYGIDSSELSLHKVQKSVYSIFKRKAKPSEEEKDQEKKIDD